DVAGDVEEDVPAVGDGELAGLADADGRGGPDPDDPGLELGDDGGVAGGGELPHGGPGLAAARHPLPLVGADDAQVRQGSGAVLDGAGGAHGVVGALLEPRGGSAHVASLAVRDRDSVGVTV